MGSVGQYTQGWFAWQAAKTDTGGWVRNPAAGNLGMGEHLSGSTQNEAFSVDLWLDVGTWKFCLVHRLNPGAGIYTIKFNGVSVGTIDGYNAANIPNTYSEITGIAVATAGVYTVQVIMATKNAASSAYYGIVQSLALIRTAGTASTPSGLDTPGFTWMYVPWMGVKSATGFSIRQQSSTLMGAGYWCAANPGTINDEWTVDIWLEAGTYKYTEFSVTDANGGISTYSLNGTSIGTIDHYNAVGADNVYTEITGIVIATAGVYTFKDKMASKNGASGGYMHRAQSAAFIRTGA